MYHRKGSFDCMAASHSRSIHSAQDDSPQDYSLLLVFYVYVLGVDYAFVFLLTASAVGARLWACAWRWAGARSSACGLSGFVHLLGQLVRGGGEVLAGLIHLRLVVGLERFLRIGQRVFDVATFGAGDLVAVLFQHLLDVVDHRVELVLGFDRVAGCLVLGRMRIGFFRHPLDFFLRETGRRRDRDLLILLRGRVLRGHIQDAVGIDVEGDLDLRHTTRSRRNPGQMELAQSTVLRRHRTFTLQDVNFDRGLAVGRGGEGLRLLGWNRRVARNHRGGNAAQRLDRERQRSHVEQEQVFHFALQHTALNSCADCDHFVGVNTLVAFASEKLFHKLLDAGHARLSTDQHDFVDLAGINTRIFHALLAWSDRALNDVFNHAFELGAGQFLDQVLGTAGIGRDERQIDLCLHGCGEFDLGALSRVPKTLQSHFIALAAKVEAFLFLEFVDEPVDQALIDVVAAEVSVTIGGLDFDDAFADFKDRNVERTATEIVDGDGLVFPFVETIGKRGCCWLVDDAFYFEAGNLSGVFGGLALRVVKVCRNGDDRFGDFLAEIVFGGFLQLLQNQRRDLGRSVFLPLRQNSDVIALTDHLVGHHLDLFGDFVVAASHEALDRIDSVLRISNRLTLGDLSDEPFPSFGESNYGRRGTPSFFIGNDLGLATLHYGDAGVGGAEVNSDNFCHKTSPPKT